MYTFFIFLMLRPYIFSNFTFSFSEFHLQSYRCFIISFSPHKRQFSLLFLFFVGKLLGIWIILFLMAKIYLSSGIVNFFFTWHQIVSNLYFFIFYSDPFIPLNFSKYSRALIFIASLIHFLNFLDILNFVKKYPKIW